MSARIQTPVSHRVIKNRRTYAVVDATGRVVEGGFFARWAAEDCCRDLIREAAAARHQLRAHINPEG